MMPAMRIGIVTVSDRAARGEYEDESGPIVETLLVERLEPGWSAERRLVEDDVEQLRRVLERLCDEVGCSFVVTTGGTGPAPRDITPEATEAVCDRLLPGFGERMRAVSVERVPTAILSRQVAGLRGSTLIVNLPGSPGALRDCLEAVLPAIPHAVELAGGRVPGLAGGTGIRH